MIVLADTHAAIWYLWNPEGLSRGAVAAIDESVDQGHRVGISAITLCEIVYLAEKERIRSDALNLVLEAIQAEDGLFEEVPLSFGVSCLLSAVPRAVVPDMPDRIIAATAQYRGVPLITKDRRIRSLGIPTIW